MKAGERLGTLLLDEGFHAIGWPAHGYLRWLLEPICWPSALRFGELAVGFEDQVARFGLAEAAGWLLQQFSLEYEVLGERDIPSDGPLLLASNHPGAFDLLVIFASVPRDDLKILASDVPFARNLPHTAGHLIYVPPDSHGRMAALRATIRHLRDGGAVLVFPSGLVDPDPAFLPGAAEALQRWSPSLELCVRQVPDTKVQAAVVSGILAEACYRHPLARLRREPWERRKLAEFIQVVEQFILGRKFALAPRVSYGAPFMPALEARSGAPGDILSVIIAHAETLLAAHLEPGLAVSSEPGALAGGPTAA